MSKTDGLGRPLVADEEYYVQDSRQNVGNCGSWWRPNGQGYTCNLDDAGVYDGRACSRMRVTDIPWPRTYVEEHVVRHVRVDVQAFDTRHYRGGDDVPHEPRARAAKPRASRSS